MTTDNQKKMFDRGFKEYEDCIRKFIDEQSKANQEAVARANAHVTAANAAIEERNQYVKDLNKASGKEEEKK